MQVTDHFTTYPAALSMGYTRKEFEDTLGSTKGLSRLKQGYKLPGRNGIDLGDTEAEFLENSPAALKQIEQSWLDEADTGKRERGNLYALAGRKMSLNPRKAGDNFARKKTKSLPGLDKWLTTANEYEKQVVHKFVSTMSDAFQRPGTSRPQSTPVGLHSSGNQSIKPKERKSVRINSKLISPRYDLPATGLGPPSLKPPPSPPQTPLSAPKTPPSPPNTPQSPPTTPPRCTESAQSCRSSEDEEVGHDVSTQLPYSSDGKPSSPLYEDERPATVERPVSVPVGKEHSCQNCEACKRKMLKRLIDELAGAQLSSYQDLLTQKARNMKTISSQMYQPGSQLYQPFEDYIHPGCPFQNVAPRRKGDFTIHPDFVSENIVDLKRLRKKHEKYFGESKVPAY